MSSTRPGPVARRLSIATRLSLLLVLVAVGSLAATTLVALDRGGDLARQALSERLDAVAAGRADEVARHLTGLRSRVAALAASPATADAISAFADAHAELGDEPVPRTLEDDLAEFYLDDVIPELEEVRGGSVAVSPILPVTEAAIRLQATWVTAGDGEVAPVAVDDNGDGTQWTAVHAELHPSYRRIAAQGGLTDLAFVSADEQVVYTVTKGIDLGTDLDIGPHSGSGLAIAAKSIMADPRPGQVFVGDLTRTLATGDRPVGVVAAPVFDGSTLVGVVAGQYDAAPISDILAGPGDWTGLGRSGQAYVAAGDDTMRSDARAFVADPEAWVEDQSTQLTPEQARAMRVLGTTVAFQPVDADVVADAADGAGSGLALAPSGTEVVASWRPVEVEGLDWVAVAELGRVEVDQPVRTFGRNILVAMALLVLAVTFLGVAWANRLVDPLRRVAERLRLARARDVDDDPVPPTPLPASTPREYRQLAGHIDQMLARLDSRGRELQRRRDERLDLLRQFLPATVAGRAAAGEQDLLERAERATVVVAELRGLGDLVRETSRDRSRTLLGGLVDDLDTAARRHGLERFRLSGTTYFAVCGAARPHLDHASRGLAFADEGRELIDELSDMADAPLRLSIGLASGPVTLGLTGGDRLVYDCWGPTVERAANLAQAAAPGELLVDEEAATQLPEGVSTTAPAGTRPHGARAVLPDLHTGADA